MPAGSRTLQRAIRTGRLENDELVGGDTGESASEPEEGQVKEVLELLKQGQVHNIGPTLSSARGTSESQPAQPSHRPFENSNHPTTLAAQTNVETTFKPKMSKFKLNRASELGSTARLTRRDKNRDFDTSEKSLPLPSPSAVVDSPPFPQPSSWSPPPRQEAPSNFNAASAVDGRRPDRPPTIISAAVVEATHTSKIVGTRQEEGEKKSISF